jgi:hypothetical protein
MLFTVLGLRLYVLGFVLALLFDLTSLGPMMSALGFVVIWLGLVVDVLRALFGFK